MKKILITLVIISLLVGGLTSSPTLAQEPGGRWVPYAVDWIQVGNEFVLSTSEIYSASLPENIQSGEGIIFEIDGYTFTYKLSGGKMQWTDSLGLETKSIGAVKSSIGAANSRSVTYTGAFTNTAVRYSAYSWGLKEELVLSALPANDGKIDDSYLEYTGELSWSAGISVWVDGIEYPDKTFSTSSRIVFKDATGKDIAWLPAPYAWDSSVDEEGNPSYCDAVYDVKVSAGKIQYGLRIPYSWLETTTFPVTIDPGWTAPTGDNSPVGWVDTHLIRDGNYGTYGYDVIPGNSWGDSIELTHATMYCTKLRFKGTFEVIWDPDIDIDVYDTDASGWIDIYQGKYTHNVVIEKELDIPRNISKIRVRIKNNDSGGHSIRLYEVAFFELAAPTVTTQAVINIAATTATGCGTITDTGGEDASAWGVCYNTTGNPDTGDDTAAGSGSGGAGAFTAAMTGLDAAEDYYVKAYATNTGGTSYGSEVEFTTLGPPTVTTGAATDVEETTATLEGEITDIGGENATVRGFDWDIDSGGPYEYNWYGEGSFPAETFDHGITGLTKGELYYYIAYASNTHGRGNGSEVTFLTKPDEPTGFDVIVGGANQANMTWTKGSGAQKTYIRGKDGSYPANRADGYEVYNDTGESCTDTGLIGGHTYYYRVWSYATEGAKEQYSDSYVQDSVILSLSLTLWFQPNAIISGTTLVDRQGSYDGDITWSARLADSGNTTTLIDSELTQADDYWNGKVLKVKETTDSQAPEGEESTITNFTAGSDELTFGALTAVIGSGDRYEIWDGETILWGGFPEGISVGVSALVGYTDPVSSSAGVDPPEVVGPPQEPGGLWGGSASEDLPLYDLFASAASDLGWTPDVLYVTASMIVAIGIGVVLLITTGSSLIGIGGVGIGMAAGMATGMLPVWILLVYAVLAGSWLYVSRSV